MKNITKIILIAVTIFSLHICDHWGGVSYAQTPPLLCEPLEKQV